MKSIILCFVAFLLTPVAQAQTSSTSTSLPAEVQSVYPQVQTLYIDLHEHPELSLHEVATAAKLAGLLRQLGYEVTEKVGGTGIVALLRNGSTRCPSRRKPDWHTPAQSLRRTTPGTTFR
jgi:hypothetical protein